METQEVLERHHGAEEAASSGEGFGRRAAVLVSVLAAALAIATLVGSAASTETILTQQKASDTWSEYQANSFKRHINTNDAALLRVLAPPSASGTAVRQAAALEKDAATKYLPNQQRLLERAHELERERDLAETRHRTLQYAEAALQLAIVLSSVAVVVRVPGLLWAGSGLGLVGLLILIAGAVLHVPLPV